MAKIEESIQFFGFAWLDSEDDLLWCTREEMEEVPVADRPRDITPVSIEFTPVDQWIEKQEKDQHGALTDALSQLNQFKADYKEFLKNQRIEDGR